MTTTTPRSPGSAGDRAVPPHGAEWRRASPKDLRDARSAARLRSSRLRCVLAIVLACIVAFLGTTPARAGDGAQAVREIAAAERSAVPGPGLTGYLGVVTESSMSGVRITRVVPGSPADEAGLRVGDLLRRLAGDEVTNSTDLDVVLARSRPGDVVPLEAERAGKTVAVSARLAARRLRDGIFRGPVFRLAVVPLRFSDDNAVPATPEVLERLLFSRTGRSGRGASLADYYAEQSHGRLSVEGDVLATVALPGARTAYARMSMGASDGSAYQHAADALSARYGDTGLADFDGIAFLYGGAVETRTGFALWPHRSTIVVGGRRVPYYVHGTGAKDGLAIGVHCHEFGHLLGLPDVYGAGHRTGSGDFCVMALGHRGGPDAGDASPFSFSAPAKLRLGWLDPTVVDPRRAQRLRLRPVGSDLANVLVVPLDARSDEYLVIENRARTGFDRELPSDGLLVWRLGGRPTPGQSVYSLPVDLVEAHGIDVFDASLVRIDEIAFPTARARDLTPDTRPALRPSSASSFPCWITDIVRERDGSIVFTLGVPRAVTQAAPAPYAVEPADGEGYVVRRDPITGEDARFYVGPREGAPSPPEPSSPGQQERR